MGREKSGSYGVRSRGLQCWWGSLGEPQFRLQPVTTTVAGQLLQRGAGLA